MDCRYNLVGSSANRILKIDEETGEITTSVDNAFDYERQTEVTVQVTATDKFEDEYETSPHITYAQVTITIEDVNDETPRITVVSISEMFKSLRSVRSVKKGRIEGLNVIMAYRFLYLPR